MDVLQVLVGKLRMDVGLTAATAQLAWPGG